MNKERIRTIEGLKSIGEMTYLIITPVILLALSSRDLDNYYCQQCISVSDDNRVRCLPMPRDGILISAAVTWELK